MSLRIAFLWHQHQPYYKQGNRFLLPWTRLHATKDYYDIAAALERFPRLRQTINVAPSLLEQLTDYVEHGATDVALELSRRAADELTDQERIAILRSFFLANTERMIKPYPRYAELFAMGQADRDNMGALLAAAGRFATQDWRDLQVWYNLTWIGEYSRDEEPFATLLAKQRGFTEEEKHALLDAATGIIGRVIPAYRKLMESGQVELSVTPYYHPILPLLCDSFSALEAMPNAVLPEHHISYPEDAAAHIDKALALFGHHFGTRPAGMWPSEGSVSDAALTLVSGAGFAWAATDEGILRRTIAERWHPLAKYFPWLLKTRNGPLWTFFRDRELSDAIGFVYSSWNPRDAALDFYNRLIEIRAHIIQELGSAALAQAVVPIILDGENCWEFYEANGRPFLEALYTLLDESKEIETTTFAAVAADAPRAADRTLGRISAGSWVGSNFKIWIGHEEDNAAWDALALAREALMAARPQLAPEIFASAMEEIYIAEGSDWFWWYGDENTAADQDSFDELFRMHLREVYRLIGAEPPAMLDRSIRRTGGRAPGIIAARGAIAPRIDGRRSSATEWADAGHFLVESVGGAMHRGDAAERRVFFGADDRLLYVRVDLGEPLTGGTSATVTVVGECTIRLNFRADAIAVERDVRQAPATENGTSTVVTFDGIAAAVDDVIEAAIPFALLMTGGTRPETVGISAEIARHGHPIERFPHQGEVPCRLDPA